MVKAKIVWRDTKLELVVDPESADEQVLLRAFEAQAGDGKQLAGWLYESDDGNLTRVAFGVKYAEKIVPISADELPAKPKKAR